MSPLPSLQSVIALTTSAIRRHAYLAIGGAISAVVGLLFVTAWLSAGRAWWGAPSPAPLVLELAAVAATVGLLVWGLRRLSTALSESRIASAGEDAMGLPRGSVRGVLELAREIPQGTSPALFRRAEAQVAGVIGSVAPDHFAGAIGVEVRTRKLQTWSVAGVLLTLVVLVGFAAPARSKASWTPLLHPVAHLAPPPLPPIVVEPGNADVPRGSSLAVRVRAPQRAEVLLEWRAAGSVRHEETLSLSNGAGTGNIPDIDARVRYWITAPDGAVSDTFTIRPLDALLVSELSTDVLYPSYLGRPPEQFQTELPSLEIPEGTELRIHGRATRVLGSAGLAGDSGKVRFDLRVEGASFQGRWVPRTSGQYEWQIASPNGNKAELVPPPFELQIIPDLAPEIEVTFPGIDTTLTADLLQTVVADARDDHGLISATLVSWRTSALGQRDPAVEESLVLEGEHDRALIRGVIDARERKLLPGDTLSYFIRVVDNSPRRQATVSQTFRLHLPSMNELRQQTDDQASSLAKELEELSKTARELEKTTRDLNRRSAAQSSSRNDRTGQGGSQGNPGDRQMDYQKAEQARSLLDRQEQMVQQVDQMRQRVEALERAMEAAGLRDPELQKRLQEMRELYDKMLTPELKKKLEELRKNIDKMDPEQVQKSLEELAKQQQEFREQLERSLELMRRAAAEQEMNALAQEAKELATQQQAVADQMKQDGQKPSPEQVEKQKELGEQAKEMNKALEELMKRLGQQGEADAAKKTGEAKDKSEEAAGEMQKAAEQAGKQQGEQAAKSGQQAADKLNEAAKTLEGARKEMAEGWKKEAQEQMDKATSDALSLAQKQNEILEQMKKEQNGGQQQPQPGGQQLPQPPQLPQPQVGKQTGQQSGQQQAGKQQQSGQQQSGQQQSGQQQSGQQQSGQQQSGQQQSGQQQSGQQQGGQQQQAGQKQQGGQQQGGQQSGQQQSGQQQSGQQQGGQQQAGGQPGGDGSTKSQQAAQKQGLEQIGKNLAETGQKSAMLNRDVGSALGRANMSMDQTLKAMENGNQTPTQEAAKTLEDLNRLALELLKNQQQMQDAQAGTGLEQALQQLAELAKQQGGVNGQSSSLAPLNLAPQVMAEQLQRLAKEQRDIGRKLDGMSNVGGREDALGRLDELAKEANALTRELEGGRLTPQTLARQERLFHRLLDAGKTLERDEYSEERKAERPGTIPPNVAKALRPGLLDSNARFRVPTEEELRGLPPAMRRYVLEYYERLNRLPAAAPKQEKK